MRKTENNHATSVMGRTADDGHHLDLLNLIPSLIAYIDKDLCYQYVNSAYERWIGLDSNAIIGKSISEVLGNDMLVYLKPYIDFVLSGNPVRFENKMYNKAGLRYLDVSLTADFNKQGTVKGYAVHINDITDKKKTEVELKDYVETASIGLHWVNANGIIIWANQAELNMLGYEREEYIGRHISEFHADQQTIDDILRRLADKEIINRCEAVLKHKDGSTRQVSINSSVLWEDSMFIHTRCFTIDITEQKHATLALKESEARYKELLQLLPAAIYTCDAEGRVQLFNQTR
jgi:PAS domain S-box-containing protein